MGYLITSLSISLNSNTAKIQKINKYRQIKEDKVIFISLFFKNFYFHWRISDVLKVFVKNIYNDKCIFNLQQ